MSDQRTAIRYAYFIGIGGIGMSALARYLHHLGWKVAGYDRDRSDLVNRLIDEGLTVHFEDDPGLMGDPDLVIYTPAVPDNHHQLTEARARGLQVLKRSEFLGMESRQTKCIAVAGTHGKTTTSTMIAYMLRAAGLDVAAFLGGLSIDFDGNFVHGSSGWMVTEADEYDRSFLRLSPEIVVITSVDPDHLDIYGTYEEMCQAYLDFLRCVQPGGMAIIHENAWSKMEPLIDASTRSALEENHIGGLIYGYGTACNIRLGDVQPAGRGMRFDLHAHDTHLIGSKLGMPGAHNVLNAAGATACAIVVQQVFGVHDLDWKDAVRSLAVFRGIRRRFEIVHESADLTVIDDYAHHPEELKAAIAAARNQFQGKKITGVFQPHLYSRTADFHRAFAEELSNLDVCILVDLYPAREQPIPGVSSELIFRHVQAKEKYYVGKPALIQQLERTDPEILLFMGAGDLDRMIPEITEALTKHET